MMKEEYRELLKIAKSKKKITKKFFSRLKSKKPRNLDQQFENLHEEVFTDINCLECANCCSTTSPIFYERDIDRLAKHLRLKPSQFIDQYLKVDEDEDYVLKSSPCPFLGEDKYCSVYESRPKACREYPHTNRKNMYQILELTQRNVGVCPAVAEIISKLQQQIK